MLLLPRSRVSPSTSTAASFSRLTKASSPADKDKWIQLERIRWAQVFNIPMKKQGPANFPPNTLQLMRALCALLAVRESDGQALLVKTVDKLWPLYWAEHRGMHTPEVYEPIFRGQLGDEIAEQGESVG